MTSLAEQRVKILLEQALNQRSSDISTALRIVEAHNVSIPERYRTRICNGCKSLLHPGKNAEVRVSSSIVKYSCAECGEVNRHGY